ncbi:MAG: 16S rRNA (adenine(1518)-N(6)/adenine(1519)-N(6))-dimethyltransferase RsmA [Pyrinomonadaceae bacterium]
MTRPKKSLGQNFLRDEAVIDRIVKALDLGDSDTVVEIGPGEGALTGKLIATGANVVAIEIDRGLVSVLRTQFSNAATFRVIEADVLSLNFETELREVDPQSAIRNPHSTKLVGNLPYYISTAILQKLADERAVFSKIVLMLQREVVERITAKPGNSERGFLTVITEAAFSATHLFDVDPTAFYPRPKVWSSVVELTPKPHTIADEPQFTRLLSTAFEQKRKTILNNLRRSHISAEADLAAAGIDSKRRAETLTFDEWVALYRTIAKK